MNKFSFLSLYCRLFQMTAISYSCLWRSKKNDTISTDIANSLFLNNMKNLKKSVSINKCVGVEKYYYAFFNSKF